MHKHIVTCFYPSFSLLFIAEYIFLILFLFGFQFINRRIIISFKNLVDFECRLPYIIWKRYRDVSLPVTISFSSNDFLFFAYLGGCYNGVGDSVEISDSASFSDLEGIGDSSFFAHIGSFFHVDFFIKGFQYILRQHYWALSG